MVHFGAPTEKDPEEVDESIFGDESSGDSEENVDLEDELDFFEYDSDIEIDEE